MNKARKDCFGAIKKENGFYKCGVLKATKCNNCSFFKTPEQLEAERAASIERLKRLGTLGFYSKHYEILT